MRNFEQYLHDQLRVCKHGGRKKWLNLDINPKAATISFLGIDGLSLETAQAYLQDLAAFSPHAVVMHLGENDLDKDTFCGARELAVELVSFAGLLIASSTAQYVVLCQLLPRLKAHCAHYDDELPKVNDALRQMMPNYPCLLYLPHGGISASQNQMFNSNGVSLNLQGNEKFLRNMRVGVSRVGKLLE